MHRGRQIVGGELDGSLEEVGQDGDHGKAPLLVLDLLERLRQRKVWDPEIW